ncbi:MAG: hypothetical protein KGY60_03305 [Bacteroidales bacterium]|nr:hypothetical protein [Bacteroidales bacterium]
MFWNIWSHRCANDHDCRCSGLYSDAQVIWPFLFITIACGAISGFHSLIASAAS